MKIKNLKYTANTATSSWNSENKSDTESTVAVNHVPLYVAFIK